MSRQDGSDEEAITRAVRRTKMWLAALTVPVLVGLLVLLAGAGDSASQNRPAAARAVSVGQPITPYRAGSPKSPDPKIKPPQRGLVELRAPDPDTGRMQALLYFEFRKVFRGRERVHRCAEVGPENRTRSLPIRPWGNCTIEGLGNAPISYSVATGTRRPTLITGRATDQVTGLRVSGPGGDADVPLSAHRAFFLIYSRKAKGKATLTATLRDGAMKYFEIDVPPSGVPAGAVEAPDPAGLPAWTASASRVDFGPRRGQTCVQIRQRTDFQARGRRAGGGFTAPLCGDFAHEPIFVDATEYGPRTNPGPFSAPRNAPRRLLVLGAASSQVEEVTVTGPDGRRVLPFAQNGRAFLTVYPPSVARASITISIRLKDGTTRDYAAPRRVGALGLNDPPLELIGALSIHQSATTPTTFVLTAALTRPAERFEVTFMGREIRMKRTGGSARSARVTYAGVYDATKGKRRTVKVGKLYFVSIIRCAQGCLRSTQAVRVGKPRSP